MRLGIAIILSLLSCHAMSAVNKFTLDNGLKVVVKEDHRAPVVTTMVWYNVGSADEPGGLTGVSHALEHLMFKGTSKYPTGTFSKKIASLGGQENAFTNYDYTAFYEKTTAADLAVSLELESDRMQNLLFDEKEFANEMKVIQEERRMRTDNNPQALTFERYMAAANLTEPYHHPIVGWMSDIKHLSMVDARSWYQSFYTPNNATLVVVGDVNAEKVHELAKLYFGQIPRKADFVRKKQINPPAVGARMVKAYAPSNMPMVMFGYPVPSVKTAKTEWEPYALELITALLDAGDSARFSKNLVRANPIASEVEAHYELYKRYQSQFVFLGSPAGRHSVAEVKAAIMKEISLLQSTEVSEAELNRIKTELIAQKTYEKDSLLGQATELGLLTTLGLDATPNYKAKISAITPKQIQAVAKRYFTEMAMTEAQLVPVPFSKENQ